MLNLLLTRPPLPHDEHIAYHSRGEERPPLAARDAQALELLVSLPLDPPAGLERSEDGVVGRRREDGPTVIRLLQWGRGGRRGGRRRGIRRVRLDDAQLSEALGIVWADRVVAAILADRLVLGI